MISSFIIKKILSHFKSLNNFLWPYFCILCQEKSTNDLALCDVCITEELPWLKQTCLRCAMPILSKEIVEITSCGWCSKRKLFYERTTAAFSYRTPLNIFINQIKFGQNLMLAKTLGHLLALYLKKQIINLPHIELILPIPLHKKRLQQRGFNQTLEMAKPISSLLNIPLAHRNLKRVKQTLAQAELDFSKRKGNMKDAFSIRWPDKIPQCVAIFDDVITTGNTVNELAKTLKKSGVKQIVVWSVARQYH